MGNLGKDIAGLSLPGCQKSDRAAKILAAALQVRGASVVDNDSLLFEGVWEADFFNLERVNLFREASLEHKKTILHLCDRGLLEEAYFIEKAGMGYMAKMVLLAETTEERMLYSLFAADEALHFSQIKGLFVEEPIASNDPFLNLLADVVAGEDKTLLLFVLQVILEGWGLSHYRHLAKGCRHLELRQLFQGFVRAEAQHHATGVSLFQQTQMSSASQIAAIEILKTFLQMIRVGPQQIVAAIAQTIGSLSRSQQIRILEELDTETHSGTRLKVLRSLMQTAGAKAIVEELDRYQLFQPLPAHQCVF
jgi:hypothetical protein